MFTSNSLKQFSNIAWMVSFVFFLSLSEINANGSKNKNYESFKTIFPLDGISGYPPEEMIENCGGEFVNAEAKLRVRQKNGKTTINIWVKNAVPYTFWTVWLKLHSPSPLTGAGVTAVANPDDIEELSEVTPDSVLTDTAIDLGLVGDDGSGSTDVVNGFYTNKHGKGHFRIKLDFPIIKGAYQFQEFDSSLDPLPVGVAPFSLRVASHCDDQVGHGLVPGFHEMWFDWSP